MSNHIKLCEIPEGEICKIGDNEFVILEHFDDTTAVIRKNILTMRRFGRSNNFDGSDADKACRDFADEIADIIGAENIVEHTVDLTSDDGLKDYGTMKSNCSLLTAEQYRRYVDILDKHKPNRWWWLATPFSTKRHDDDTWVKCVSPSGCISNYYFDYYDYGVRPFCILKSTIFVSK